MDRKHFLRGLRGEIPITADEFEANRLAMKTLNDFTSFTENYRLVVESYRKVESAKHEAELDHIINNRTDCCDVLDTRVQLNATLVGYLASACFFRDSTDKQFSKLLAEDKFAALKKHRSDIYDSIPEYRFVEALRNYVQHRELPVHTLTYQDFIEDKSRINTSDWVTCLSLYASRRKLKVDAKFKQIALEGLPEDIDLILCIRHHMEGIWSCHDYILRTHGSLAVAARSKIASTIELFQKNRNQQIVGLKCVAVDGEGVDVETIPILLDWDDARKEAISRLASLKGLHKRHISGKIRSS